MSLSVLCYKMIVLKILGQKTLVPRIIGEPWSFRVNLVPNGLSVGTGEGDRPLTLYHLSTCFDGVMKECF